jgi:hypothetical protein
MITSKGLKLDALHSGDIISVKLKKQSVHKSHSEENVSTDQHLNAQHYRMTNLFEVVSANAGQVAVKRLTGYGSGDIEVWPIHLHEFFEASDLFAAVKPKESD